MKQEMFEPHQFGIFDFIQLCVITISVFSLIFLCFARFDFLFCTGIGISVALVILRLFHIQITWRDSRFSLSLFAVLMFALGLRSLPYNYFIGGQDPGVYENMSSHFLHSGKVIFDDELGKKTGKYGLLEYYKKNTYNQNEIKVEQK